MIQTENLSVVLGGQQILDSVHMSVGKKQIVGLIGPNGSGKSTLLKCVYRVLRPTCGAVLIDGQNLYKYSVRQSAQKMAIVAQHHHYSFDFTVWEIVLMGRSPHKRALERDNAEDERIVHKSLETVGMAGRENQIFSTLSGGEQQRVVLARALAQQTPCLILDEPTNHLDIQHQLQIMELISSLDKTVLLAVHDLNLAAVYCDRLFALQGGKLVGSGTPQELLTPAFIEKVYHVRARVGTDEEGRPYILYRPMGKEKQA